MARPRRILGFARQCRQRSVLGFRFSFVAAFVFFACEQSDTEEGCNQLFWTSLTESESTLRGRHRRLSFLKAGHATFTVACQHVPSLEQEDGCSADFTPYQEAQQLMLAYSVVFARAHVLGDQVALQNIRHDENLPARPSWVEWLRAD